MKIKIIQKIIDKLRKKKPKSPFSEKLQEKNNIQIQEKNYKNFCVNMEGVNNTIILEDNSLNEKAKINIQLYGDNNNLIIKKGFILSNHLTFEIGRNLKGYGKVQNCRIEIGENTSIESCTMTILNSNSYIDIGRECMFANEINLYNTDSHPVLDFITKKIINRVKGIKIGNHCWIGRSATILKNSIIPDDCIVGWGAVVSSKFDEQHCAIAGNPARIVKQNITWMPHMEGYISQKEGI